MPKLRRALTVAAVVWVITLSSVRPNPAGQGGWSLEIGSRAEALQLFGCTVWVFNPKATIDCLLGKLRAEFEKGKQAVLGAGVDILGCRASLGNIPAAFQCLRDKIGRAAADARRVVLGQGVNILGCQATLGNIPGTFQCLQNLITSKVSEAVAKAKAAMGSVAGTLGGALGKVLQVVKPMLDCMGIEDLAKLAHTAVTSPANLLQPFFAKMGQFLKSTFGSIFSSGGELLMQLWSSLTGTRVSDATLERILAWLWERMESLSTFVPPARCMMSLLRPMKTTLHKVAKPLLRVVLDLAPTILEAIRDKIGPILMQAGDKVIGWILGKEYAALKDRVKGAIARVLDPAQMMKRAASRLTTFLEALNRRSPDLRARWKEARALITSTADFGLNRLVAVAETAVGEVIDWVVPKVTDAITMKVVDLFANLLDRIDGACGLIPEVGGPICTFVMAAVRFAWDWVLNPLLRRAIVPIGTAVLKALAKVPVNKLATWLQGMLTGKLHAAADQGTVLGTVAKVLTPIIDIVFKLFQSAFVPTARMVEEYNQKVAELGDIAVAMAEGGKTAGVASLSSRPPTPAAARPAAVRPPTPAAVRPPTPAAARPPTPAAVRPPTPAAVRPPAYMPRPAPAGTKQRWYSFASQLIHCGVKGESTYGKVEGCRIKSGPGCNLAAVPGQCSFPFRRAVALCRAHPQCAGFTCNKRRRDCQARDAAEVQTLVMHRGFRSATRSSWREMPGQLIHCGVRGQPGYAAVAGCRIKSGRGCNTSIGQCSFPKNRAHQLCLAHPQCRGFTCNSGRGDCQARDADEVKEAIAHPAYRSHRLE